MEKRNLQIVAGNISGLVLDVVSGMISALAMGAVYLATVNGAQADNYSAYFGEPDKRFNFEPFIIHIETEAAVGVVSAPAISIGTNAPNYNNILSTVTLSGLSAVGTHSLFLPSPGSMQAMYGQDIYVNITSAGIGTQLDLSVDLIGSFQP